MKFGIVGKRTVEIRYSSEQLKFGTVEIRYNYEFRTTTVEENEEDEDE